MNIKVQAAGSKFQILVNGELALETESQGEVEETLRVLRAKPKKSGQTLPTAIVPTDPIQEIFDNIEHHFSEYLTDWEQGFIVETQEWYIEKHFLTPLQRLKLDDVLSRCVKRSHV
jgi:hypothetical protein